MSSKRFPGKVLAPFRNKPIIEHVVGCVRSGLPGVPVVVATSAEHSDNPLAHHLAALGVPCFRGPLDDVWARFLSCLAEHPCDQVLRICADSPLLDGSVLAKVVATAERNPDCDLITTIAPRSFPKGQNAEVIRSATLRAIDPRELGAHDREHVTAFFHRQPERFRILNVSSGNPRLAELSVAVDTVDDLQRLEQRLDASGVLESQGASLC